MGRVNRTTPNYAIDHIVAIVAVEVRHGWDRIYLDLSLDVERALISVCLRSCPRYMLSCIIVCWLIAQERTVLYVEINIAGYRFSREIPDLRRKSFRSPGLGQRAIQWRLPHLRQSHAA
jgi:hypothetical protein